MPNTHEPILVNAIGHSAGAIIFGIFLFLLVRDGAATRLRGSWKSLAAASLAFLWNVSSLATLLVTIRTGADPEILVAVTFSILSVLPAVLFDVSLQDSLRSLVRTGYLLSASAVTLHFAASIERNNVERSAAFLVITVGFAILTVVALVVIATRRDGQGKAKRMAGAMCSALFAISFVHFSSAQPANAWSKELALHHAGLPLALFVLLQDYRFVLLDAFIRFLANAMLAAIITFAASRFVFRFVRLNNAGASNAVYEALLLVGLCLLLVLFALLRTTLQRWLTKVVFRRPDLDKLVRELRSGPALLLSEPEYLSWATQRVAESMGANRAELMREPMDGDGKLLFPVPMANLPSLRRDPSYAWAEALVPVRLGPGDMRYILVGRRKGGRRYLSEDLQALSRLAAAIAEQVDRFRTSEMQRLVSQAELRALQSQMNPHFLFNALNALYGIIPREVEGARRTVTNLAQIFRYFLQTDRNFITLSEELEIVKAYLEIEALRLGPRLRTQIEVDDTVLPVLIPVLSIQPLVENAVKHGLAPSPKQGTLRLSVQSRGDFVYITVNDTGIGIASRGASADKSGTGVGLANVTRRLKLCYGPEVGLEIDSNSAGTTVSFSVPRAVAAKAV